MGIRADMFAMRRYVQAQIRCGSGDFERGEESAVVGAGDVLGFQIAHVHALCTARTRGGESGDKFI